MIVEVDASTANARNLSLTQNYKLHMATYGLGGVAN
jgi:hypothetical protein